ncbi:MAG: hypothetical protein ACE5G5_14370 [Candidatus Methylomirabilales bacterium]
MGKTTGSREEGDDHTSPGGIMRIINDLFADQFARHEAGDLEWFAGERRTAEGPGGSSEDPAEVRFERDLTRVRAFFSQMEDADLASLFFDLQQRELLVQTSLAASARLIQPTLMDFLR